MRREIFTLLFFVACLVCGACSGGSASVPGSSPTGPASGASTCVDPRADVLARAAPDVIGPPGADALVEETVADLDGDGVPETLLAPAVLCGATGNCPYVVYLSGDGCARYAGSAPGVMPYAADTTHHGVRDLSVYWKGGCLAMEGGGATLAYDGNEYRAIDTYACECPYVDMNDDRPNPERLKTRDPRCPSE